MRIKTITTYDDELEFDKAVNEALGEGWSLISREAILTPAGHLHHYAQLVLSEEAPEPEPQAITWLEALKVLQDTCKDAIECSEHGCSMFAWCEEAFKNTLAPAHWELPDEEV